MERIKNEHAALGCLLLAQVLVRLPFWPLYPVFGDGANYCYGALFSYVGHPPGYIGYCVLGRLLNYFVGDIQISFVAISVAGSVISTALVFWAGKEFGLTWPWAWLAAAMFGFSVNTLVSGLLIGPYVLEGIFVALFALLSQRATRTMAPVYAGAATLVFSVSGLFRPSTTFLLAPLWLFWLLHWIWSYKGRKLALLAAHVAMAAGIVAAWRGANNYFMRQAGYGNRTYEMLVLMPSTHEYATFSTTPKLGPVHLTYHMPFIELTAWAEAHTGIRILPQVEGTPIPSVRRALTLATLQAAKQAWWLFLSAPIVAILPFLWLSRRWRRSSPLLSGHQRAFLALWIIPAACFFVVGHMGQMPYLQIYLPAVCIGSCAFLMNRQSRENEPSSSVKSVFPAGWAVGAVLASLVFFVAARPTGTSDGLRRGLDVVALNWSGYSIRNGLMSARMMGNTGQSLTDNPISRARTDEQMLQLMRSNNFSPAPAWRPPESSR